MYFKEISLTQFKNYDSLKVAFSEGLNVFSGLNGMGKTNLLDALYYCCMTKSYFTPQDKYTVKEGREFFRLKAAYEKRRQPHELVVKVQPGKVKVFTLDGVDYDQLSAHLGEIPVVIVAPKDVEIILGGSAERRRFIDSTFSQLSRDYLAALLTYHQLLNQRNAHLKLVKDGKKPDYTLLEAYAENMAKPAEVISRFRAEGIADLASRVETLYARVATEAEQITLEYVPSMQGRSLQDLCSENLRKDCILGRTSAGVHKDDIHFTLKGMELKKFASQGQIKSFLIALNLGKYFAFRDTLKVKPIIFLDDSFGKLDYTRTMHLLDIVSGDEFGQVFITDTSADKIRSLLSEKQLKARIIEISNGDVASIENFAPEQIDRENP